MRADYNSVLWSWGVRYSGRGGFRKDGKRKKKISDKLSKIQLSVKKEEN